MKGYISETELYPVVVLNTPATMDWEPDDFIHEVPDELVTEYFAAYTAFKRVGNKLRQIMEKYNADRTTEGIA